VSLSLFHPDLSRWFAEAVGRPTAIQEAAWGRIARGEHVLVTAPTGTGKTFTAFLWAINDYITGKRVPGHTSILYVSPLKALNNDIRRNLTAPLSELMERFEAAGKAFPQIRVATRSGDTSQAERRRMLRYPPEILITTPESLNLLISSIGGRSILTAVETVILDEIHSLIPNKRGVHLITAVDRLVQLSGEFQRIALSATVKPVEKVAAFVGGYQTSGPPRDAVYHPRTVSVVSPDALHEKTIGKAYDLQVCSPTESAASSGNAIWDRMVTEFRQVREEGESILIFANSRRLAEKLALLINRQDSNPSAYAHHGSLSRELREGIETAFKNGLLKTIVSTNSLELGIDIGTLEKVLLVQSPPSISSAIQRLGRSGHQVGDVSRGIIFPTHPKGIAEAAAMIPAIVEQDIEEETPLQNPLDVLGQIIIAMTGVDTWEMDSLFQHIRTSYPYRHLSRDQFIGVLDMLQGRYADTRIPELKSRITVDPADNTVKAKKGALLTLYMAGGTIPDRGYYMLRHMKSRAIIGELDEEFVWEARVGQTFTLGTQNWRIHKMTHNDVFVTPGRAGAMVPPFWKADEYDRRFHFSERIGRFLEAAQARLTDDSFLHDLMSYHRLDAASAETLVHYLQRQVKHTGCPLPHRHHLLIEHMQSGPDGGPGNQTVLHTFWGNSVNRPLAIAFESAWEERFGQHIDIRATNDCIIFLLPHQIDASELLSMVTGANLKSHLRKRLEQSGYFGARFREAAGRSLLLAKRKINERLPLWLARLQSQRLLTAVSKYDNFPILLEAWRTCLADGFDLRHLTELLSELATGTIKWTEAHVASPSPFARDVSWQQINRYMYMDDSLSTGGTSRTDSNLIQDLVMSPYLRPSVPQDVIRRFEEKRHRRYPGYSPDSPRELVDWVKERVAVPADEWRALWDAVSRDHQPDISQWMPYLDERLIQIKPAAKSEAVLIVLRKAARRISRALYLPSDKILYFPISSGEDLGNGVESSEPVDPPAEDRASGMKPASGEESTESGIEEKPEEALNGILSEWIRFYGPLISDSVSKKLGISSAKTAAALGHLIDTQKVISGKLVEGVAEPTESVCDAAVYESLLRLKRTALRPALQPLAIDYLPLFVAEVQGIAHPENSREGLLSRIEQLLFYCAPADIWEKEILPSRLCPYDPAWLDSLMQETDLLWIGSQPGAAGKKRVEKKGVAGQICFAFESDLDLMENRPSEDTPSLLPSKEGRYDFSGLLDSTGLPPAQLTEKIWEDVWQGLVTNDTFIALRKGMEAKFTVARSRPAPSRQADRRRRLRNRSRFTKWKAGLPSWGYWHSVEYPRKADDALALDEVRRERIRILFSRYGVLFRELLRREMPGFRWPEIFRTLRIMELSGEALTGHFFEGIPGPQFVAPRELNRLEQLPHTENTVFRVHVMDPASLCGVGLDSLRGKLPRRLPGTHMVFRGTEIALVSERFGKTLTFHVDPKDPDIGAIIRSLHHLTERRFQPEKRMTIDTINSLPAAESPYVHHIGKEFETHLDVKSIVLYRSRA